MKTTLHHKALTTVCTATLAVALLAIPACTQSQLPPPTEQVTVQRTTINGLPTLIATDTIKASVTVEAIDYADRSIALTGPNGDTHIFHAGADVANFNQIKKGDTVNIEYLDRLALAVRKVDQPLAIGEAEGLALAPIGTEPGIFATRTVAMDANVTAINYDTRDVTLQPLAGKPVTLKNVDAHIKRFNEIKVGDQVIFNYTEAVCIYVAPKSQ